jgi:hypothetical protein
LKNIKNICNENAKTSEAKITYKKGQKYLIGNN